MKKLTKYDIIYILILSLSVILLFSHIPYGRGEMDESFYLSTTMRLINGDSLLVDEWHVAQLNSLILYPILKVYLSFTSSLDGIIIAFRKIFVCFHLLIGTSVYLLLRRRNNTSALLASGIYLLFIPNQIFALSYISMGIGFTAVMACIFSSKDSPSKFDFFIIGFLMSLIVLCNPYMVIPFILYVLCVLICTIRHKETKLFKPINIHLIITGICPVFIGFLFFVFSRSTLAEVIENLPYCLSNSSHTAKSISSFLWPILTFAKKKFWFSIPYVCLLSAGLIFRKARGLIITIIGYFCLCLSFNLAFVTDWNSGFITDYNSITLGPTLLGFACILFYWHQIDKTLLRGYIVGIVYSFCSNLSSNQGITAISMSCVISSCFALAIVTSIFGKKVDSKALIYSFFILQLVSQIFVINTRAFMELTPSKLTYTIEEGPMEGCITTQERYYSNINNYYALKSLLKLSKNDMRLVNYGQFISGYLIDPDIEIAGFSTFTYDEDFPERIIRYSEMHSDKKPTIIYVDNYSIDAWNRFLENDEFSDFLNSYEQIDLDYDCIGYILR